MPKRSHLLQRYALETDLASIGFLDNRRKLVETNLLPTDHALDRSLLQLEVAPFGKLSFRTERHVNFCAIFGMIQNPAGVKGTLLSFALIVVVVLVSYFIAASHDTVIPDFASGGVFPRTPTVIADCGIIVTYVAMIAAVVVALYSEVAKLFK